MMVVAQAIAPAARQWLTGTPSACVLNVFEHACNLVNASGEVLSIVSGERGMTPFAMQLPAMMPAFLSMLSEASVVRGEADRLRVGPLTVTWGAARSWDPSPDWPAVRRFFATSGSLGGLAAETMSLPTRGTLLDLFRTPAGHSLSAPLTMRIRSGAESLIAGLRERSESQALEGARTLSGTGGGLTPAGDDFIVGSMLAIWAGLYGPGLEPLAAAVATAAERTTTLSGAYLRAAAHGECAAPWHSLFEALVNQPEARRNALEALLAIGHTSGGDGLAGVLAAYLLPARTEVGGLKHY